MSTKNCDVFLRDLESLLKKSLGEETKILSQKVENLLPKGENYGSTILKVSIKTDKEEDLELVAKMTVTTDYQKSMMDCTIAFKKEIFVFEELRPIYEEIQREAGFKDLEILDFFPKFFGSRLSRNFQSQEADEDVVLLMENLKFKGYMQMNRKIGLDPSHVALVLKNLASFHALGILTKNRKPEFMKKARLLTHSSEPRKTSINSSATNAKIHEILRTEPKIAIFKNQLEKCLKINWESMFDPSPESEWSVLIHGDVWVNNVMFHHDKHGNPDKVKFVDFQEIRFSNCLKDLMHFLFTSGNVEVIGERLDEMLKVYHDSLLEALEKLNFEVGDCFGRECFYEKLREEAAVVLVFSTMELKYFTMDVEEDFDLNDMTKLLGMDRENEAFRERLFVNVKAFVDKKWI